MKDLVWNVFKKTGSITSYLLYKEIERYGEREKNERDYQTSAHPRSDTALH
ncbi:MAG: YqzL family protein [Clostridiales bacterium]|jgi:hypothetical protein|nr:YqzL family protein [Clostridiales bacterium]